MSTRYAEWQTRIVGDPRGRADVLPFKIGCEGLRLIAAVGDEAGSARVSASVQVCEQTAAAIRAGADR
jgi:hypothetical protein